MKGTLSPQKKKFARKYATNGRNGVKAAKEAFEMKNYNSAHVKASRLIQNDTVSKEIEKIERSIADAFSYEEIVDVQRGQLKSTRLDHMVFPLGPEGEDDINLSGGVNRKEEDAEDMEENELPEEYKERTTLTDQEIMDMLKEVNCQVRRIVHGNTARHVYFWSPDNMARDKALDKIYKLKRLYESDGAGRSIGVVNIISFRPGM